MLKYTYFLCFWIFFLLKAAAAADDLSQTIMADDGVLERVGKKEEQPKEPSPPRVRSKRKMESCPFCVRSFTDKENLKEHMRSDHFGGFWSKVKIVTAQLFPTPPKLFFSLSE